MRARLLRWPTLFAVASLLTGASASRCAAASEHRLLSINGRPDLAAFADGLRDPADLNLYASLGFNLVIVDLPWKKELDFRPADQFLAAAAKFGLAGLVRVHAGEPPPELHLRVDSSDPSYASSSRGYLQEVALHFRTSTAVCGYLFENDAEQHQSMDDDGFRSYLARFYPTVEALNADWGSSHRSFRDVTLDSAASLSEMQYGGLSRPAVQLGEYRLTAYRDTLSLWARALKEADQHHPVISGRQELPRGASLTPALCEGVVVDGGTGNLAAVDIARHGGGFDCLVMLGAETGSPLFCNRCLLHGAGGFGWSAWPKIAQDAAKQASIKTLLTDLRTAASTLQPPEATSAVVYEPLAPGAPEGGPAAPFGYMPQPADMEPGTLLKTLSRGSAFGLVDVVSPEDLLDRDLTHYRVIFAPSLFAPPPGVISVLGSFARAGGVVVTDLGLDLLNLGRLENRWPDSDRDLFGIDSTDPVQFANKQYPHRRHQPPLGPLLWTLLNPPAELLPDLTPPVVQELERDTPGFSGPRAYIRARIGNDFGWLGLSPPIAEGGGLATGILFHRVGRGYVIFASFRLWSQWSPTDPIFVVFHGGLMARSPQRFLDGADRGAGPVDFVLTAGGGFQLLQSSVSSTGPVVRIAGMPLHLLTHAVQECLPVEPPACLAHLPAASGVPISCQPLPIYLTPRSGPITVFTRSYSKSEIELDLCGSGASWRWQDGSAVFTGGADSEVTLTVRTGLYEVAPGSQHELTVTDLRAGARPKRIWIAAGADGQLVLTGHFSCCRISIRPAAP